jgi:DNA repair exonuclease SbcCD ATPase subunit
MVNDVSQWLAEIRTLQRQVVDLTQERDQAYASAANWRRLYEAEAQQRRQDAEQHQERVQQLQQELDAFQGEPTSDLALAQWQAQVDGAQSVEELRSQLLNALQRCEQFSQALRLEQTSHEQTKNSLTAALGDTIDLLAKERTGKAP